MKNIPKYRCVSCRCESDTLPSNWRRINTPQDTVVLYCGVCIHNCVAHLKTLTVESLREYTSSFFSTRASLRYRVFLFVFLLTKRQDFVSYETLPFTQNVDGIYGHHSRWHSHTLQAIRMFSLESVAHDLRRLAHTTTRRTLQRKGHFPAQEWTP